MSLPRLWLEKFRWPKAGSEFVFVADAALRVGDALYEHGWTTDPSKAQISTIAAWIGDRCRDGLLGTGLLMSIEKKLVEGNPSNWLGNKDDHIIRNGRIELLSRQGVEFVFEVFIVRADLEAALAPLPHASTVITVGDLCRYSDHLQFAVGLAKKWNADRNWSVPKRATLTDNIRREWRASRESEISPEAAERIGFILKGSTRD